MKTFMIIVRNNSVFLKSKYIHFVSLKKIKHINYPSCKDCIYFKHSWSTLYDDFGKCTKFGIKNKHTGEVKFLWADINRMHGEQCGPNAKNKEVDITKFSQIIYTDSFDENI
jgi:hypothetical protein